MEQKDQIEKPSEIRKDHYKKYCSAVSTICRLTIAKNILAALLGFLILFLPFYEYQYEPTLEEIETWDQVAEALVNDGKIVKGFSLFDDFRHAVELYRDGAVDLSGRMGYFVLFITTIFGIVEILLCAILVVMALRNALVVYAKDSEDATKLKYNEIKKGRLISKKEYILKQLKECWIPLIIICIFIDLGFSQANEIRFMQQWTGFSPLGFIILAVLIGYYGILYLENTKNNALIYDISHEEC